MSTHRPHHHKSHENRREEDKMQVSKESKNIPALKKDEQVKPRSQVIQNLIREKQQEKEQAQRREKQQKEAKEKLKNSFRIPKKKPDVEKLISSLFDDTETTNKEDQSDVPDKKQSDVPDKKQSDVPDKKQSDVPDKKQSDVLVKKQSDLLDKKQSDVTDKKYDKPKTEGGSSDMKNSSSNSSSSHKEKHSLSSNNLLDKGRDTTRNTPEKPSSSVHSNQSHKSHSNHKSSSSSSKQSEHKSGLSSDSTRSSSASKDHKNKSSSSSEIKSSSKSQDSEHSGKHSSSAATKHSSTHSSSSKSHGPTHSSSSKSHGSTHSSSSKSHSSTHSSSSKSHGSTHSSSSKNHSSSSSKEKESSSSKPELKPSPSSSKPELKPSPSSSKPEIKPLMSSPQNNASSPRSTGIQSSTADQQPIVLNKHHLHPIVERQAPSGLSEKEKILARLAAIKQRTLEAIHKENSGKGRRFKGEKSHRKSKNEVKHDDRTKSVEIVRDIPSSDEEDTIDNGIPSALDIMLSERNAKLEKEKITRMAKQAWERATKKDTGDSEDIAKVKKKHRSLKKDGTSTHKQNKSNKDHRKSHHKVKDRSVSPHNESGKLSPKPKKQFIVRHSIQSGAPPMDFKALLEMAEKKQKEPPKSVTAIPKKKKEEDKRPLTQDEKDRIARKKSKEYQDWLKFGGKPPPKNDISDEEDDEPPTHNSVDKKHVSSYSTPNDKHTALSGSSKQSFNKNTPDNDRSRHPNQTTANGDRNSKARNITINENVLVCGPAASSEDEKSPDRSGNPFDRIMNQFNKVKKRPAPSSQSAVPAKKNHLDDTESEDYDSDMDDFIDDGAGDEPNYSKEISKLFGYDKNKYKNERHDDLSDMEADFSTVMMEEKRSAKLGLMEDLEDMRKEQEELKKKAMLKKRK